MGNQYFTNMVKIAKVDFKYQTLSEIDWISKPSTSTILLILRQIFWADLIDASSWWISTFIEVEKHKLNVLWSMLALSLESLE